MVNSIYEQLSLKSDDVMSRCGITYLRRQVMDHAIINIDNLRDYLEKTSRNCMVGEGFDKWFPLALQVTWIIH